MRSARVWRIGRLVVTAWLVALLVTWAPTAALAAPSSGPGAHGNHVSLDAQRSADGTVLVESFFSLEEGYLVIRADDGGEPGRPIGHRSVDPGYHSATPVEMDDDAWAALEESATVWVVLHEDDGDGTFEPLSDDEPATAFGEIAADSAPVGRSDEGAASVVAKGFRAQRTATPDVTVRAGRLPADGYLVVTTNAPDQSPGRIVGSRALSAGRHVNTTIGINATYFEGLDRNSPVLLWAVVYRGTGQFDPATDDPITVAGEPVASRFTVRPVAPNATTTRDVIVRTPTSTATTSDGGSGGALPGPGVGVALAAVLGTLALLAVRGRQPGSQRDR